MGTGTEQAAAAKTRSIVPAGTRYGRYEVISEIASGGMATVYLGRALGAAGFQRLVAIKVLHPHVERDDDFVAMFMDEARLAARIRHPNVVPTLDLENGDDGLYLVMEFVEGDGLLGLLKALFKANRRVPAAIAVRLALDALHGLHAAHELTGDHGEPLRLVHRDVSPHNILVGVDGVARITDFGVAHAEQRIGNTREGQVKGKLAYMAPEQSEGAPLDRRVDVFALGVVLWECLAGRRLFWGANDGEVLRNLLHKPVPSLCELNSEVPASLDAVVQKALARDPNGRFTTAAQFADALEEAGGSVGIASPRAVSALVRELSGARIEALSATARAYTSDLGTSAVRPLPRTRLLTDPERTVRRSDPPGLGGDKPASVPPPVPLTVRKREVPPTLVHEPAGEETRAERPSVRVAAARAEGRPALWFAGGAALALVLTASGAFALRGAQRGGAPERVGAPIVVGPTLRPGSLGERAATVGEAALGLEARGLGERSGLGGEGAALANDLRAPEGAGAPEPAAPTRASAAPSAEAGAAASAPRRAVTARASRPTSVANAARTAPSAPRAAPAGGFNPEAM